MENRRPLKIAFFPSDTFGCGYYRMILPSTILNEMGHKAVTLFSFLPKQVPMDFDIYHFQRVTTPAGINLMKYLKRIGKVVLMDMDDDLFHLYPGHPSSWYFRKGQQCLRCGNTRISVDETRCNRCGSPNHLEFQDRLGIAREGLSIADAMTFSTPELISRYGDASNAYYLVPNYIDFSLYEELNDKSDDYLAVGWAGSFTHTSDLKSLGSWLNEINNHENVYFVTSGENPNNVIEIFKGLDKDRLIQLKPVDILLYPGLLKNFDIGLAPIIDNAFNQSKSELKATEYGAAKVPVIASDVSPYTRYVSHGEDGFLVKKPREWKTYLNTLITNTELRKTMAEKAFKKAKTMDIRKNIGDRVDMYYEVIKKKHGFIPPVQEQKPVVSKKEDVFKMFGGRGY